jgi:uncharacterized membrane protein YdjX (TVP38/TMEM64 family)
MDLLFQNCQQLQAIIMKQSFWAPLVYIGLSIILTMCFVPRTLLVVVAGICFGTFWGTIWVLVSSMLSSFISFIVGRRYARAWVDRLFRKRAWFHRLQQVSHDSGFYIIFLTRIVHMIHFGSMSYASGILNIKLSSFLWGTFLGILPGTLIFLYSVQNVGCRLWDEGANLSEESLYQIVIISVFMVFVSFVPWWLQHKRTKRKS